MPRQRLDFEVRGRPPPARPACNHVPINTRAQRCRPRSRGSASCPRRGPAAPSVAPAELKISSFRGSSSKDWPVERSASSAISRMPVAETPSAGTPGRRRAGCRGGAYSLRWTRPDSTSFELRFKSEHRSNSRRSGAGRQRRRIRCAALSAGSSRWRSSQIRERTRSSGVFVRREPVLECCCRASFQARRRGGAFLEHDEALGLTIGCRPPADHRRLQHRVVLMRPLRPRPVKQRNRRDLRACQVAARRRA